MLLLASEWAIIWYPRFVSSSGRFGPLIGLEIQAKHADHTLQPPINPLYQRTAVSQPPVSSFFPHHHYPGYPSFLCHSTSPSPSARRARMWLTLLMSSGNLLTLFLIAKVREINRRLTCHIPPRAHSTILFHKASSWEWRMGRYPSSASALPLRSSSSSLTWWPSHDTTSSPC